MAVYQELGCRLTLQEALRDFREVHAESLYHREMTTDSRAFFRNHDTAHVVFACDTSLLNEAMVKAWIAFGTTLGFWRHIAEYSRTETTEIVKNIAVAEMLDTSLRSLVLLPKVILRCRAMSRRWPWTEHEEYDDRMLVDIRREFNISPIIVP